ncbi:single-stranded DNA-binding protein [Erysipelothrix urinaevulpis]|uniref:single-stranded DNA-binding protein n=1 Tax=Erysipelothrix urinaevulpis TaxID=2683717 RepID=UPI00135B3E1A|nr:single-stranded DNA-binding protein [Erysipelothrix urinaevulpis]
MINRTILVGRLTRDPELRKTGTGKSVVNFTIACNRQFGNRDEADFISCVAWNQTADFMANYLTKGALVGLEGRIQTGSYEDRETGKVIYTTDVIVDTLQALESRSQREQGSPQPQSYARPQNTYQDPAPKFAMDPEPSSPMDDEPVLDITSDDLPF